MPSTRGVGTEVNVRATIDNPGAVTGAVRGNLSGLRKAAVLVLSLEESAAAEILRALSDREVELLMGEIADLGMLDQKTVAGVLEEFRDLSRLHGALREGGVDHALRLVEKTFPPARARDLEQLLESHRPNLPFAFLSQAETDSLVALLDGEKPQTIAVVLAHMAPNKAWEILERFEPGRREDLIERVANLEGTHDAVIRQLERSLRRYVGADAPSVKPGRRDGVSAAADIVKASGGDGAELLDVLRERAPEVGAEVSCRLLAFEEIARLDTAALRRLLRGTDRRLWALALKTAASDLRDRVLRSLPSREARGLRRAIDRVGPITLAEIDAAKSEILENALSAGVGLRAAEGAGDGAS